MPETPGLETYQSWLGGDSAISTDAINPDHYKFPGGAEVIQISEWLSANGAQAFQYIARATRVDGKQKGEALEDLEKAAWFVQREIDRLEELKKEQA